MRPAADQMLNHSLCPGGHASPERPAAPPLIRRKTWASVSLGPGPAIWFHSSRPSGGSSKEINFLCGRFLRCSGPGGGQLGTSQVRLMEDHGPA